MSKEDDDVPMTAGAGVGAGAGDSSSKLDDDDVTMTHDGEEYVLSSLLDYEDLPYRSVCVTTFGNIVTGGGDSLVKVWEYDTKKRGYAVTLTIPGPPSGCWIRCLLAGPAGSFISGADDGIIRVYNSQGTLMRELGGHSGKVQSLAWLDFGVTLLSGAWDGEAREWDVATATCSAVLGSHENVVTVAALGNGNIVTGSTGHQKKSGARAVEFRTRLWEAGSMIRMLDDHTDAVKDVCAVPGIGFATAGNDGCLKVRDTTGSIINVFKTPVRFDGFHNGIFTVKCLPGNVLATCQEDMHVRLYTTSSILQEIVLPGDGWDVAALPNGDLVTVGAVKGRGGIGVVWTRSLSRLASDEVTARYEAYISAAVEASSRPAGEASAGGGGLPEGFSLTGQYADKAQHPGKQDNDRGFFQTEDGQIMLCMWSAAAQEWVDLGYYAGAGAGNGGSGPSMGLAGKEAELREQYDYVERIDLDMDSGTRVTYLTFNATDNPEEIVKRYMKESHVPAREEFVEQIRTKVYAEWRKVKDKYDAENKRKSYKFFPNFGYLPFRKADSLGKAVAKLGEFAAADEHKGSLNAATMERLAAVQGVLSKASFYHSSTVTEKQMRALQLLVDLDESRMVPVLDLLRVAFTHPDAAKQACRLGLDAAVLRRVIALVSRRGVSMPVLVLGLRCLNNFTANEGPTSTLFSGLPQLLAAIAPHLSGTQKTLQVTLCVLLVNLGKLVYANRDNMSAVKACQAELVGMLNVMAQATKGKNLLQCLVGLAHVALVSDLSAELVKSPTLLAVLAKAATSSNADVVQAAADLRDVLGA